MAKNASTPDPLQVERDACIRTAQVDVEALQEIANAKQQLVDRFYSTDEYRQAHDHDQAALQLLNEEHERLAAEASDARIDAQRARSDKDRAEKRIVDIDDMLGAKAASESAKIEYGDLLEMVASKLVRRTVLRNTIRDQRLEITRSDEQGKQDVEAALERDIEARIAGKSTAIGAELQNFENTQSVRRASLAKAERMLLAADDELRELHQRLKQIARRYFVARRNMLRLQYSTAMAQIAPTAIELAAACRLAGVSPDEPAPLNDDDVKLAADAIAAELPSPPTDRVLDLPGIAERNDADSASARAAA